MSPPTPPRTHESVLDVRHLATMDGVNAASALFHTVWPGVAPPNMLRAVQQAGGYLVGAFDADDAMVGATFAFLGRHGDGPDAPLILHSHLTAAVPSGRGTGTALKRHQRAWAAANGLAAITWTFDPLIARNAWFNLAKLGATATTYHVDQYGHMDDPVNAGQGSDRLLAWWPATGDPAPAPAVEDAAALLTVGGAGDPVPHDVALRGPLLVAVPADVETLRRRDPDLAIRWRLALRDALGAVIDRGWTAIGFDRPRGYVLAPPEPHR